MGVCGRTHHEHDAFQMCATDRHLQLIAATTTWAVCRGSHHEHDVFRLFVNDRRFTETNENILINVYKYINIYIYIYIYTISYLHHMPFSHHASRTGHLPPIRHMPLTQIIASVDYTPPTHHIAFTHVMSSPLRCTPYASMGLHTLRKPHTSLSEWTGTKTLGIMYNSI